MKVKVENKYYLNNQEKTDLKDIKNGYLYCGTNGKLYAICDVKREETFIVIIGNKDVKWDINNRNFNDIMVDYYSDEYHYFEKLTDYLKFIEG